MNSFDPSSIYVYDAYLLYSRCHKVFFMPYDVPPGVEGLHPLCFILQVVVAAGSAWISAKVGGPEE